MKRLSLAIRGQGRGSTADVTTYNRLILLINNEFLLGIQSKRESLMSLKIQ